MYALFDITYSDRPVMVKRGEFEICQYYMDHTSLWAEYIKNTIQAIEKMG
jgi:hypothetical protein